VSDVLRPRQPHYGCCGTKYDWLLYRWSGCIPVGAVKGLIGLCSYIAASAQELISASLIEITEIDGVKHYDGVVSVFLALTVWNAKKVVDIDEVESKKYQATPSV